MRIGALLEAKPIDGEQPQKLQPSTVFMFARRSVGLGPQSRWETTGLGRKTVPKQCPDCERVYPDFVDFCVADGAFVRRYLPPADSEETQPLAESQTDRLRLEEFEEHGIEIRARLFPKVDGKPGTFGVEFSSDVVLGRFDPDVGIVDVDLSGVPDADSISPTHARLTIEGDDWFIEDLDSENGVFVNGSEQITGKVPVKNGDQIALGSALFVFEVEIIDHDAPEGEEQSDDEDVTDTLVGMRTLDD